MEERQFIINESLLAAVINFMGEQKFSEVYGLVGALQSLPPVENKPTSLVQIGEEPYTVAKPEPVVEVDLDVGA
jgi:hypothetical protein